MTDGRSAVSDRTYRSLDVATKVAGVALVAAGLEAGGGTATGVALAALGVALGLGTVFLPTKNDD
jgi:hypothetical protein